MIGAYQAIILVLFLGHLHGDPNPAHPAYIEDVPFAGASRVVAGWPAAEGQFPHQVSLRMISLGARISGCGGSIISPKWVLTAAHCIGNNRVHFMIRYGVTNLTRPAYIAETNKKYFFPTYNQSSTLVQTDDIGLLEVDAPVPLGPTIQPVRLQSSAQKNKVYTGIRLTVSGFGRTDDFANGGGPSEILLWTFLRGISNEECLWWYPGPEVQDQTLCAEYYNNTAQSACQGDSGGPLTTVDLDGQITQIGLVSFGSSAGCNSPYPSAYVRPGHYHEWLLEITGINFDWDSDAITEAPSTESESSESSESTESSESSEILNRPRRHNL